MCVGCMRLTLLASVVCPDTPCERHRAARTSCVGPRHEPLRRVRHTPRTAHPTPPQGDSRRVRCGAPHLPQRGALLRGEPCTANRVCSAALCGRCAPCLARHATRSSRPHPPTERRTQMPSRGACGSGMRRNRGQLSVGTASGDAAAAAAVQAISLTPRTQRLLHTVRRRRSGVWRIASRLRSLQSCPVLTCLGPFCVPDVATAMLLTERPVRGALRL